MTLGENKKIMLSLIEEYAPENEFLTEDEDIKKRINILYNAPYYELALTKKIRKDIVIDRYGEPREYYAEYDLPDDLYQIEAVLVQDPETNNITVKPEYYRVNSKIYINDNSRGNYIIKYYAYPTLIKETTKDTFKLELDMDAQMLLPYAVASDILKADPSADYVAFESKYQNKLMNLDTRQADNMITVSGGISI